MQLKMFVAFVFAENLPAHHEWTEGGSDGADHIQQHM